MLAMLGSKSNAVDMITNHVDPFGPSYRIHESLVHNLQHQDRPASIQSSTHRVSLLRHTLLLPPAARQAMNSLTQAVTHGPGFGRAAVFLAPFLVAVFFVEAVAIGSAFQYELKRCNEAQHNW